MEASPPIRNDLNGRDFNHIWYGIDVHPRLESEIDFLPPQSLSIFVNLFPLILNTP